MTFNEIYNAMCKALGVDEETSKRVREAIETGKEIDGCRVGYELIQGSKGRYIYMLTVVVKRFGVEASKALILYLALRHIEYSIKLGLEEEEIMYRVATYIKFCSSQAIQRYFSNIPRDERAKQIARYGYECYEEIAPTAYALGYTVTREEIEKVVESAKQVLHTVIEKLSDIVKEMREH